jgi:hypothetical protein
MDIKETLRILLRRWYITGPLLLLAVAGSAALAARPGPYQSVSQVVLLPSAQSSKLAGGNPYLSFDDSVTLTADLLRRQLTAPPVVQSLGKNGYRSSYQVVDDPLTAGPVLDITVTGNSKSSVEHTLAGVTDQAGKQLLVMQGHVAPIDRITLKTVSYDPKPSLVLSRKARTPLVALAIGLVLTVALPLTVDAAVADRRKASRSRAWSLRAPARRTATVIAAVGSSLRTPARRTATVIAAAGSSLASLARRTATIIAAAGSSLPGLARRTATVIAAAGSWARRQLLASPSVDSGPATTADGLVTGATRSLQPSADDRLWADGHSEDWPGAANGEHPGAGIAGHESRASDDDGSAELAGGSR